MIELIHGDCLEEMPKLIARGIKFDAIIADVPYGTTACKWDSVIPFKKMWALLNQLKRDDHTPIVLFGSEPFSSVLRCSNLKQFKYDWVWGKTAATNFLNAKKQPLKNHEIISVFYNKQCTYNPQMTKGKPYVRKGGETRYDCAVSREMIRKGMKNSGTRYPVSIQRFSNGNHGSLHPTQKPVELMEHLVKTYTNVGEAVLDFTMGSGTTGAACKNLNRNFVGVELDGKYFNIAKERINK